MGFEFFGAILFASVVALAFGALPLLLKKFGFFDYLGQTKLGTKIANFFGSSEPSKFSMNMCRVLFFLLIGYFIVSGITTDATQYEIHKPVILEMESCNNTFFAQQFSIGEWAIKCYDSNKVNPALNLSGLDLSVNLT